MVRSVTDVRSDVMYGNVGAGGFETVSARGVVDSLHGTVIVHVRVTAFRHAVGVTGLRLSGGAVRVTVRVLAVFVLRVELALDRGDGYLRGDGYVRGGGVHLRGRGHGHVSGGVNLWSRGDSYVWDGIDLWDRGDGYVPGGVYLWRRNCVHLWNRCGVDLRGWGGENVLGGGVCLWGRADDYVRRGVSLWGRVDGHVRVAANHVRGGVDFHGVHGFWFDNSGFLYERPRVGVTDHWRHYRSRRVVTNVAGVRGGAIMVRR